MTASPTLDTIFAAAVELPPPDRAAYIARACGADHTLRDQVERLVAAHFRAGDFLADPAPELAATIDQAPAEGPGSVVGPYRLVEQVGEGGMGVVFVAEQQHPVRRKVALKLIKPGMDTREVIARFEQERQALALMDHPHIAKVLDAGATDQGRPYFVMELVRGIPVTDYCDRARLDVRHRLGLFVQVCQAVQHAHQKGVIHRDLKPTNVLVTEHDGTPVAKVIDFGVAKAVGGRLTDKTVYTRFLQLVGSPLYMSPEQAGLSGLDVDTRADIYALGVLLYELLTGTTPFDKDRFRAAGYDEVRQIIREEEPPKPSTRLSTLGAAAVTVSANRASEPRKLSAVCRGDLDWVVMTALEKDRNRRYETAAAFAADVQRYLTDQPVLACPPSAGYRVRKFVRRNRAAVAVALAAALVVALGVAGLAASHVLVTRERERVVQQKDRGDRHLARVKKVVEEYLANTAADRRLKAADLHDLRKALLTSMVTFLEELARDEGTDKTARVDRGWAHYELATIWAEVGEPEKALAHFEQSRAIRAGLAAETPDGWGARKQLADCDNARGALLLNLNRVDEAEQYLRQALAVQEQLVAEFPTESALHGDVGATLNNLSNVERRRGNRPGVKQLLEQAIVHQTIAAEADPRDAQARRFLANHHNNLGVLLMELNQPAESAAAHEAARSLFAALAADYPSEPDFRAGLASSHNNLGLLRRKLGNLPEAAKAYRQAIAVLDRVAAEAPSVPDYRRDLAHYHNNLSDVLGRMGQAEAADAEFDTALALREQLVKEHPTWAVAALELGMSRLRRGAREADAGRLDAALPYFTGAVDVLEPLADPESPASGASFQLCNAHGARADALLRLGRHAEAVKDYDRALALDRGRLRSHFRVQRAVSLAHLKEHVRAAAEAAAVAEEKNVPAYLLQDAAGVHALCSAAARDNPKLSEQYAATAVALLRRAFEANYQAIAPGVPGDKNLDAIRSRPDFQALMKEWAAKPAK